MAWWFIAASLASSLLSNNSSGDTDRSYANYNAGKTLEAGGANAYSTRAVAGLNSQMSLLAGQTEANSLILMADYNSAVKSLLGDKNAQILENEANIVWQQAGLDVKQLEDTFSRQKGEMQVGYAASGVIMNQDSPLDAVVDAQTKHEMDVFVVKHGADIQANKLLDAAARSRWEGNMEAQSIAFEGRMNAIRAVGNATLRSLGYQAQGAIDAESILYNASVDSDRIKHGGYAQGDYADSKADSDMWSGIFNTASKVDWSSAFSSNSGSSS